MTQAVDVELIGGPSDGHIGVALALNCHVGIRIPIINIETGREDPSGVYLMERDVAGARWIGRWTMGQPADPGPPLVVKPCRAGHSWGPWTQEGPERLRMRRCSRCPKVDRWD